MSFEAPINYNLADFYIQTLAIVSHDRENSLARVEVSLIETMFTRQCCFYLHRVFVINMNNQEFMLDMLLKLNNIMKSMMINRNQLMVYLKNLQSTIRFCKVYH